MKCSKIHCKTTSRTSANRPLVGAQISTATYVKFFRLIQVSASEEFTRKYLDIDKTERA